MWLDILLSCRDGLHFIYTHIAIIAIPISHNKEITKIQEMPLPILVSETPSVIAKKIKMNAQIEKLISISFLYLYSADVNIYRNNFISPRQLDIFFEPTNFPSLWSVA
jgi:hypothetical protein